MPRCERCPVPDGTPCRGERVRIKCHDPSYRALFARMAGAEARGEVMPRQARPPGPGLAGLRSNALACPHNEAIPPGERAGCGCHRKCTREPTLGNHPGGGTDLRNCWFDCPISPRLFSSNSSS